MSNSNPHWEVVLYNQDSGQVVLYNKNENTLTLHHYHHEDSEDHTIQETHAYCTMCGRPFIERADRGDGISNEFHHVRYMDRNYFRLLDDKTESNSNFEQDPIGVSDQEGNLNPNTYVNNDETTTPIQSETSHSFNEGYYQKFFIEQQKLGRGYRGSVFLCMHVLDGVNLGTFAVKKIPVGDRHDWLVKMLKEVTLLERLRHPNVIEYKHAWLEPHQVHRFGPTVPCLFILMERANGGNLEDFIELECNDHSQPTSSSTANLNAAAATARRKRTKSSLQSRVTDDDIQADIDKNNGRSKSAFSEIQTNFKGKRTRMLNIGTIWFFFRDISRGLAHLHQHGVIHRDLKPQNLLLHYGEASEDGDYSRRRGLPRILISDFGECEIVEKLSGLQRSGTTGTMEFMAPELLKMDSEGHLTGIHSTKADIWSLGILLYYICFSTVPYSQVDNIDILKEEILGCYHRKMFSIPNDRRISSTLRTLMNNLLSSDPNLRPSIGEILSTCDQEISQLSEYVIKETQQSSILSSSSSSFSSLTSKKSISTLRPSSLQFLSLASSDNTNHIVGNLGSVSSSVKPKSLSMQPLPETKALSIRGQIKMIREGSFQSRITEIPIESPTNPLLQNLKIKFTNTNLNQMDKILDFLFMAVPFFLVSFKCYPSNVHYKWINLLLPILTLLMYISAQHRLYKWSLFGLILAFLFTKEPSSICASHR